MFFLPLGEQELLQESLHPVHFLELQLLLCGIFLLYFPELLSLRYQEQAAYNNFHYSSNVK